MCRGLRMWMLMATTVQSYDNNQVIVDRLAALRTCISKRHHAFYSKMIGGIECDTGENVKLTLIAYLLQDYQVNAEDKKDLDCLQVTNSARPGWKLINVFLDYVQRECRDCFPTGTSVTVGNAGSAGAPPAFVTFITTQSGDPIITQGSDNLIT